MLTCLKHKHTIHGTTCEVCEMQQRIRELETDLAGAEDVADNALEVLGHEKARCEKVEAELAEMSNRAKAIQVERDEWHYHSTCYANKLADVGAELTAKREQVAQYMTAFDEAKAELARVRQALSQIANHPHCQYDKPGSYSVGVTDGHRCAAMIAKAALEQKPSLNEVACPPVCRECGRLPSDCVCGAKP